MKHKKTYLLLATCATVLAFGLPACAPTQTQHGNMLQDYQIAEVKPNIHSRTDVLRILGSPTTQSTFDSNLWYYIGQEKEKRGILDPQIIDERIVLVSFNEEGIVERIEDIDRERIHVAIEDATTPTQGNERTIAQEFFGNLGKFNPPAPQ